MLPLRGSDDSAKILQSLGSLLGMEMPPLRRDCGSGDPREPAEFEGSRGEGKGER